MTKVQDDDGDGGVHAHAELNVESSHGRQALALGCTKTGFRVQGVVGGDSPTPEAQNPKKNCLSLSSWVAP